MRALTLIQPWAHAIVHGSKRVENRTWAPTATTLNVGDRLAIHAGRTHDTSIVLDPMHADADEPIVTGAIVGVATFRGIVRDARNLEQLQRMWFAGPIGWLLDDVIAIEPVSCSGARGLWLPSPRILQRIHDATRLEIR